MYVTKQSVTSNSFPSFKIAWTLLELAPFKNLFVKISLVKNNKFIIIKICDNAGGIKALAIDDIFKPFHSNKIKPSTGIGLYMTKLIVENQFHGTITASNIDKGAQFTIQLPEEIP